MSTTKHEGFTPGPWQAAIKSSRIIGDCVGYEIETYGQSPCWIAMAQDDENGCGRANARLIADAPNLYIQLQEMTTLFRQAQADAANQEREDQAQIVKLLDERDRLRGEVAEREAVIHKMLEQARSERTPKELA